MTATAQTTADEARETDPPLRVTLSAGLGLAFPERDYLAYDPFDGDRDVDIRCRTVKLARARKEHHCMGLERGGSHAIFPGELHRLERAVVEGEWRQYRVCVSCMDRWLTEIGRMPASPNAELTGAQRPAQEQAT